MPREWIEKGLISLIAISAALIYAILLGSFLAYRWQKDETARLRQQTIAKCLDAGGHIGPEVTCWHDKLSNKREVLPD
jgi:hypothetical protein